MDNPAIGQRIRRLRDQKAWTQEHLADAACVSVRTIQRAEDGVMSAESLQAISAALGESVDALQKAESPYPAVAPVLFYDDATTVDWIERVFELQVRMKIPGPGGKIVHAELLLGEGLIMIGAPLESRKWTSPRLNQGVSTCCVYAQVEDVDAHCARVTREPGARVVSELEDVHGQRRYMVADPEGHVWCFFTLL